MKPSLMLGTSTGQELLFVRIMSKSHTSAWKTNVYTHRLVSTSTGLTQSRILHLYLTYQPNGNYVTQTFLSPPDLAIRCFPGTQLYLSTAGQSHSCCLPAPSPGYWPSLNKWRMPLTLHIVASGPHYSVVSKSSHFPSSQPPEKDQHNLSSDERNPESHHWRISSMD